MKDLKTLHGKRFTAKIQNTSVKGKICVDECYGVDCVYLCLNARNGDSPPNQHLFGYQYGWVIYNFSCPEDNSVTELKIIETMTKEEIENYKDFKEGDEITNYGYVRIIDAVLNNTCFTHESNNGKACNCYSKTELYNNGWRLHVTPEEESLPIVELTLEEIAKLRGINVEQLRIKE